MRALPFATFIAALLAITTSANAQSRSEFIFLQDRVQRLEAQLGAGGQTNGLGPQTEAQLSLRISQLEDQVRTLTGQVDEARFTAQQLQEQLQKFQEDTEFRFRDLEGGGIAPIPDNTPLTGDIPAPDTGPGAPAQILGQLPVEGPANEGGDLASRPLDLSALAGSTNGSNTLTPPVGSGLGSGQELALAVPTDPRAEFELGYSLIITQDYVGAEGIFREFIASYPDNAMVADAHYWIGEAQFQRGAFRDAADTYLDIYTRFTTSPQAAPSLLRLAQSLNRLDRPDAACTTLAELRSKFGDSIPTVAARAQQDARDWGC